MKYTMPEHGNSKNKTVLYVGGFELPDKNAAAQRVISNAKILRTLGYDVVFITIDNALNSNEPIINTKSYFEGFSYFRIQYPNSIFDWLKYLVSINAVKELLYLNPAILIAYNFPAIALLRLKKFCKTNNIKILGDCTEWYEVKGNIIFRLIKGLDVYLRMQIIHPKLDGLIVISKYLLNFYKTKNENILLLPPLVDLSMSKWKTDIQSINDNSLRLVYAGSPGGGKKDRIDKIIGILTKIKETSNIKFIFIVVGITKSEYLNLFKTEILPHNIEEFVFFKGRLSHLEALKEIINADYQIFIRDKNLTNVAGFPTKYVESISCGTPVLTNSSSNIEDFFMQGKTGFMLDVTSESTLENDLVNALSLSKESIKQMSDYCKTSSLFDYHNFITPFVTLLNKVIVDNAHQNSLGLNNHKI